MPQDPWRWNRETAAIQYLIYSELSPEQQSDVYEYVSLGCQYLIQEGIH